MLMIILRVKYKKDKNLKFISHLELMKTVERIFRRMKLPMKFSQGYNPRPKLSFAAPLPVGVSGESEYLDVELTETVDVQDFIREQGEFMPDGLELLDGSYLEKSKSLMSLVTSSEYVINVELEKDLEADLVKDKIISFLNRDEIIMKKVNKKGKMKETNIRERIYSIEYMTSMGGCMVLRTKLSTGSEDNLKPEVMMDLFNKYEELGLIAHKLRIHRIDLKGSVDGNEVDLMSAR